MSFSIESIYNYVFFKLFLKKNVEITLDILYNYWLETRQQIPNMLHYSTAYERKYGEQPEFIQVNFGEFFDYFKSHGYHIA